jgi:AcrR family transcriptional regulator
MSTRKYKKTKRAEQQEQTRDRIIKAIVALHEELGPAKTSIRAVAEKAGVQRLTVYRYFPDDLSLFQACTSHWLSYNPPPDVAEWQDMQDAKEKTTAALLAFYSYYRATETMWTGAYRDLEEIAALQEVLKGFEDYIDMVRDGLLTPWKLKGKARRALSITLRHCLRFTIWQSLKSEKLNDKQIVELVMTWIDKDN